MIRGDFVSLALIVIVTGFFVLVHAAAPIPFFPKSLQHKTLQCSEDRGQTYDVSILDEFEDEWFSSELRAMRETPLFPAKPGAEVLRFTWLRSFHPPVVVRADRLPDGRVRLTAKRGIGSDGCKVGAVDCVVSRILSPAETERLRAARAGVFIDPLRSCLGWTDGARWIAESNSEGHYAFAQRHSPTEGDAVHEFGRVMTSLTGWTFDYAY